MTSIMRLGSNGWATEGTGNIGRSNGRLASSVGRLSSGNRLVRASDDVAGLSIATRMQSQLSALKMARINMAQATSLLQVMDGGLEKIQDAVLRMQALATQASSGTLSDTDRGFLNQEFQQLSNETSRIANGTQFSGIFPLNSNASATPVYVNSVALDDQPGERYSAMLTFNGNWAANNQTIDLGTFDTAPDERFYWRNNTALGNPAFNFQNSASLQDKLQSMVTKWNDPTGPIQQDERFSRVKMELDGINVRVTARSRGDMAQLFAIGDLSSSATIRAVMSVMGDDFQRNGASTIFNYVLEADGTGSATGLEMGSTIGYGATGGALIANLQQNPAEIRLHMTGNFINNQQLRIDDGQNGLLNFVFRTTPTNPFLHIQMGANTVETLDNAVTFLNNFVNYNQNNAGYSTWYSVAHLEFSREGNDLVIRHKLPGNPADLFGNTYNFRDTLTNGTIDNGVTTGASLNMVGGVDSGVNTAGVINKDFTGVIQGFQAAYISPNKTNLSVKVGDATYTAYLSNTNPSVNDRVRFFSPDNGYFDVDLQAWRGSPVNNQKEADTFAKQFDAAFSGITFYQQRTMTNFEPEPPSPLVGTSIDMKREAFDTPLLIEDFKVTAAQNNNGSARISMTIGGETFISTQAIDRGIWPTAQVTLHSLNDYNRTVTFHNDSTSHFDLKTPDDAALFEKQMKEFLPFGSVRQEGTGLLRFQADSDSRNAVYVATVDATSASLFGDGALNIGTAANAQAAVNVTSKAIKTLTSMRAGVGSSQQQSQFVSNAIESTIRNESEAKASIADVNVAFESTAMALEYVKLNAGISALAQITNLRGDMVQRVIESLGQDVAATPTA